jgi:hypothetical protein
MAQAALSLRVIIGGQRIIVRRKGRASRIG